MDDQVSEPIEEFSHEELDRAFREAIETAERLHKSLALATEDAGYTRQVLITSYPRYALLYNKALDDPSFYPVVASGLHYVQSVTNELNRLLSLADAVQGPLSPLAYSTGSFSGTIDAAISLSGLQDTPGLEPIPAPLPRKLREEYSARLRVLDPSLALTYDQVWQTYYGTSADRYRSSLFMMRQVFDHFFFSLAPDDLVHQSQYWTPKPGEKSNQIYRSERIKYAAYTHIKGSDLAATLAESAKQINALYESANEAHTRGTLDEGNANKALLAMDSILKDWIDALA